LVVLDGYEKSFASVGNSTPFWNHLTFGAGEPERMLKKLSEFIALGLAFVSASVTGTGTKVFMMSFDDDVVVVD